MEKILALTTFLDDVNRYERGRLYEVDRVTARRLSNLGWVLWGAEIEKSLESLQGLLVEERKPSFWDKFRKQKPKGPRYVLEVDNSTLGVKSDEVGDK